MRPPPSLLIYTRPRQMVTLCVGLSGSRPVPPVLVQRRRKGRLTLQRRQMPIRKGVIFLGLVYMGLIHKHMVPPDKALLV